MSRSSRTKGVWKNMLPNHQECDFGWKKPNVSQKRDRIRPQTCRPRLVVYRTFILVQLLLNVPGCRHTLLELCSGRKGRGSRVSDSHNHKSVRKPLSSEKEKVSVHTSIPVSGFGSVSKTRLGVVVFHARRFTVIERRIHSLRKYTR